MSIYKPLPSKDWPPGVVIWMGKSYYVKRRMGYLCFLPSGKVIRKEQSSDLHSNTKYDGESWFYTYLPPEFFD